MLEYKEYFHSYIPNYIISKPISPLLKWPGGKGGEIKFLIKFVPKTIKKYYEPFVGSGAFFFSINTEKKFINDACRDLVFLYRFIKNKNKKFYCALSEIDNHWKSISKIIDDNKKEIVSLYHHGDFEDFFLLNRKKLVSGLWCCIDKYLNILREKFIIKLNRIKVVEKKIKKLTDKDILDNIESAIKSVSYCFFRHCYNSEKMNKYRKVAVFYFLRDLCFSSMFRFNSDGFFNVPYGGISYNRKSLLNREELWKSNRMISHLKETIIENMDFEEFLLKYNPTEGDFIFFDPPYDSKFNTYSKISFTEDDHKRLASFLSKTKANFMLVIKKTDFILDTYKVPNSFCNDFDKNYLVSFMNRNDKNAKHLIIRNYKI